MNSMGQNVLPLAPAQQGAHFPKWLTRGPRLLFRQARHLNLIRRQARRGRPLQAHGKVFLRDFYDASREIGIRPFLMWGTLLGCVREGRLLAHDRDVDVGILASDYARKDALIAAMQKRGYGLMADIAYKLKFAHPCRRLHMDVDVLYPWNEMMIFSSTNRENNSFKGGCFPRDAFRCLREIIFLGDLKVFVPDPPETVLETIYGDWRTPVRDYHSSRDHLNRLLISADDARPEFPTTL